MHHHQHALDVALVGDACLEESLRQGKREARAWLGNSHPHASPLAWKAEQQAVAVLHAGMHVGVQCLPHGR